MASFDEISQTMASRHKLESYGKDWFEEKYLGEGLNCRQIADLIGGITRQAIWKRLKKFDIPIRSKGDAILWVDGQRCKISQDYFWIWNPYHLRANGGYVKRSVLVLEEKLGRKLDEGEFPHHVDGNRMNDDPDNLTITDRSNHMKIHIKNGDINHR